MKAVIQRVSHASVTIENQEVASIQQGLLILLGIVTEDTQEDIQWLSNKIVNLRIFNDVDGVMNNSLKTNAGDAIVVSQFTLHANTKKGNR
ncbi:MAG: D-tyrosyl-tRNA(Tyr) deacylase, partial [Oceanihabitans sp.]|nr:D-tyrosyl-tRNA(Tyr) deacylase [Oceanihabitans sp.]